MDIDNRSVKDIENRIKELSQSYVPEWHFDPQRPDIGVAIAKIFALQMKENIDLENRMMNHYHAEFVNMLDVSLKAARPASSMVQFELIEDTIPGTRIRKGTRLVASSETTDSGQVIFETDWDIYVTNSRITDAFMTDREDASFVPLLGNYSPVPYLDGIPDMTGVEEGDNQGNVSEENEAEPETIGMPKVIRPFVLFSEVGNIARSALVMYHESLFDIEDEPIFIRLEGNSDIIDKIVKKEYIFKYYSESGFTEFDVVALHNDKVTFELKKHDKSKHMLVGGKSFAVVILEAVGTVKYPEELTSIGLSASGKKRYADFVCDGTTDLSVENFSPFTDTLSVYNECYIGQDLYFSKGGSKLTISFNVSFKPKRLFLTKQEEDAELKIIKKKPKVILSDIPVDTYCDEISMEYFNGLGWKKLPLDSDISGLFADPTVKDIELSFICPEDWAKVQVGAYFGRAIRLRLLKSDNCYLRPGVHHYPVIKDFYTAFTYDDKFTNPGRLFRIAGTEKCEITKQQKSGESFVAMSGGTYSEDALYIGFNNRFEGGPISLYFELENQLNMNALKCRFEYSTINGFKPLRIVDNTKEFSRSGTVNFMPPSDMHNTKIEGKKRFWIRIRRGKADDDSSQQSIFLPHISRILTNVVYVSNIISGNEENYYLTEVSPNQHFSLGHNNILDAEVWVNEKRAISREEIDRIVDERPNDIKIEKDMLGNISAVYVKWKETDGFEAVDDPRCYMIDRVRSELIFSDGKKAKMPRVLDDTAFKVRIRTSDGKAGNVEVGAISETVGNALYVDRVTNPVRAYGGSDMESVPEAFRRGANILSSRRRLVSNRDYVYAILEYSDSIDKAACLPGMTVDGKGKPQDISFVLLMKDFLEGSFSFHRIAATLKQHLLDYSPMTISPDHMFIVEPIFVSISVTLWVGVVDEDTSFETQSMVVSLLDEYFNPVSGNNGSGWDIGIIPKKTQIMTKLGTLKGRAVIKKTVIIAQYVDKDGEHELDIEDINVNPFMVAKSGEHKVYIEYD